jgi:OmpA-OmpF porin, OOP family
VPRLLNTAPLQRLGLLLAASLITACASPTERIVLLPNEDGRASAVIVTRRDGTSVKLDQPYAAAQVSKGAVQQQTSSAADMQSRYGLLMQVAPPRVRQYLLQFEFNRAVLTAESQREADRVLTEAALTPAAEIDVIGHTDARGSIEYNDTLGRTRAQYVANLMVEHGFDRTRLSVQSRGKRDLLSNGAGEAEESRNRRVEIRLR